MNLRSEDKIYTVIIFYTVVLILSFYLWIREPLYLILLFIMLSSFVVLLYIFARTDLMKVRKPVGCARARNL